MIFDATVGARSLRVEVQEHDGLYCVLVDGRPLEVDFQDLGRGCLSLIVGGRSHEAGLERVSNGFAVQLDGLTHQVELHGGAQGVAAAAARGPAGPARLLAPMPGKIVRLLVSPGAAVEAGQGLVVMEAMKMENELRAPRAGLVREVPVREGQAVESGALLALVE